MDCSLPGSSVHGIFQARILEWVAISFSRGSSQPKDQTLQGLPYHRQTLYHLSHQGISLYKREKVHKYLEDTQITLAREIRESFFREGAVLLRSIKNG